jgi:hypothetical protein
MKLLASIFLASSSITFSVPEIAEGETKKVCVDVKDKDGKPVKDAKTGKVKQNCKEVKVHKKLEGTKVPEKK